MAQHNPRSPSRPLAVFAAIVAMLVGCSSAPSVESSEQAGFLSDSTATPQPATPTIEAVATPAPTATSPATSDPEPRITGSLATDEPFSLSGRAQFDQMVIERHDALDGTASIDDFHAAVDWACAGLGTDLGALPEHEQAGIAELLPSCQLQGQDHYPDEATGLTSWSEIMDSRWQRVIWWNDQDAFVQRVEAVCTASTALEYPLDGLSTSAYDEILQVRYTGECRYLPTPDDPSIATVESARDETREELNLEGTIFYNDLSNGLWTYDVESGQRHRLVGGVARTTLASLSPAGNTLAFVHEDPSNNDVSHLSILGFDTGTCRQVATWNGRVARIEWAPGGEYFAIDIWDRELQEDRIDVVTRDGEQATALGDEGVLKILASNAWIDTEFFVSAVKATNQRTQWQLRSADGSLAAALAASDGNRVAGDAAVVSPQGDLFFTAGEEIIVTSIVDVSLVQADSDPDLFPRTEPERTELFPTGAGVEAALEISPDGQWLSYTTFSGLTPTGVYVSPVDAPGARIDLLGSLLEPGEVLGGAAVWAPDSSGLLVALGDHVIGPKQNHFFSVDGQRVDMGFGRSPFAWTTERLDLERLDCAPTS